jgi:hypothetical protein
VARLLAKARKIEFQDLRAELDGDLDTDGFLRGNDGLRAGLDEIRYTSHIRTNADEEKVREFVNFVKSRFTVNDSLLDHIPVIQKRSSFRGDRFALGRRVAKGGVRVDHRVPGAFRAVVGRPDATATRTDELEQGAGFAYPCVAAQAWGENGVRPANFAGLDFAPHAGFSFFNPCRTARRGPQAHFPAGRSHQ